MCGYFFLLKLIVCVRFGLKQASVTAAVVNNTRAARTAIENPDRTDTIVSYAASQAMPSPSRSLPLLAL